MSLQCCVVMLALQVTVDAAGAQDCYNMVSQYHSTPYYDALSRLHTTMY